MSRCSANGVAAATNPKQVNDVALSEGISMLEFLSYVAARIIAGVMTALILAMIFNHQCNKAVQFTGAATASV
jgi:glycerol uptake facilitator-like aquaporin